MQKLLISVINFYQQWLSFDTGMLRVLAPAGACRHDVRCSEYTKLSIEEYGVTKGIWMGLKRIISCR